MSGFEWFLLVVVVILVPLVVAVAITLWTLEQARQRKRQNRAPVDPDAVPTKRKATREPVSNEEAVTTRSDNGTTVLVAGAGAAVMERSGRSGAEGEIHLDRGDAQSDSPDVDATPDSPSNNADSGGRGGDSSSSDVGGSSSDV